jgi:hypothetical protein
VVLTSAAQPTAADLFLIVDRGAQGIGASDAATSSSWAPTPRSQIPVTKTRKREMAASCVAAQAHTACWAFTGLQGHWRRRRPRGRQQPILIIYCSNSCSMNARTARWPAGRIATPSGRFVSDPPTIKMLALSFLVVVGVVPIAEGFDHHVPKGYVYVAMALSLGVKMLNIRMRKRAQGSKSASACGGGVR